MKIIAIGGIPAVGKTTIINNFFKYNSWWEDFKFKKVYGHINRDLSLIIVGKYGGDSIFAGTDRLSMAVHPDFKELLTFTNKYNILFEGDRLFTKSILEFCDNTANLHTIIIESNDTKLRHKKRKDNASEHFFLGHLLCFCLWCISGSCLFIFWI